MEASEFAGFPRQTFAFLRGLADNNKKAWFDAHRAGHDAYCLMPAFAFVAALGPRLSKIAPTVQYAAKVNGSIFRINRDHHQSTDRPMAFRDNLAKLRSLAGEKGYRLERGVVRDTWILTHEKTGKRAVSSSGKTAFSVEKAIAFLKRAPERP